MENRHIADDGAALLGAGIGFWHLMSDQVNAALTACVTAGAGWATVKLLQHFYDRFFRKPSKEKK